MKKIIVKIRNTHGKTIREIRSILLSNPEQLALLLYSVVVTS